ncbi:transport system permease protein [Beutenbergia cavernae DSM 12333]|uniref:Transport system permease protein n=1 Tax=Beutenbergia cavernae (strain ATCC BAA-8 / DSM 12333 / CCUG 43141 / JCM 11478 / NBRC 16432 / NCIMB 13614 / HKI 0122) TaxID=471853 RepID=C5BXE5_BEUC1|nr:putative F420-0 ABC transporter permease subunit [Beutenbergia cavernae]ACQ80828.1 transport system permease protein [Beutenbergia cavernae DSM 12333]
MLLAERTPAPASEPSPGPRRPGVVRGSLGVWLAGLGVALAVSFVVAVAVGTADISPGQIVGSAWHHAAAALERVLGGAVSVPANPLSTIQDAIIWQGRAPRVVTAAAVGAGLAIAGAVMQALMRNPLADPYLLGISSGATLGAVAVLLLGVAVLLPVAAFGGALLALALTLALAGATTGSRLTPSRTILAGVAVAQGCAAVTSFVIFTSAQGDSYREVLSWLMGSLGGATWLSVAIACGALAVVGTVLVTGGRTLDAFAFGDTSATSLGVGVARTRWIGLGLVALLVGALVSVSGSIGFVGLVVPHAVRLAVSSRHVRLLPVSAGVGAIVLLWADTLARTVIAPRELPVGILTAAIGAPVFAVLLLRSRRGAA